MYLSAKTQSDVDTHPAATLAVVGSHKPTIAKESFTCSQMSVSSMVSRKGVIGVEQSVTPDSRET